MEQKTLVEKRFFEWHEDEVSVTLRNKSGSYGGGSEVLVICSRSGLIQPCDNRGQDDDACRMQSGPAQDPMCTDGKSEGNRS